MLEEYFSPFLLIDFRIENKAILPDPNDTENLLLLILQNSFSNFSSILFLMLFMHIYLIKIKISLNELLPQ